MRFHPHLHDEASNTTICWRMAKQTKKKAATYKAGCFCGAVEVEVTGKPVFAGYCHCRDCQAWSAAPINAFSLWKSDSVRITKGEAE